MTDHYPEIGIDYQKDVKIDKHHLDDELVSQSSKMVEYTKYYAQSMFDTRQAEKTLKVVQDDLKNVYSELDGEARKTPPPTDLAKQTDESIKQWVYRQQKYRAVQQKVYDTMDTLNKCQYKSDLLFGPVMAFNVRGKNSLPELVRLFGMAYWSEPRLEGRGLAPDIAQADTERAIMQGPPAIPLTQPVAMPEPKVHQPVYRAPPMASPSGIPKSPPLRRPTPKTTE